LSSRGENHLALARAKTVATRAAGQTAERPGDIPARGWKDILLRLKDRVSRDNISIIAAGVAFYAFLAIPSALTALVSLYGLMFDPSDVERQVSSLQGILPGEAANLIGDQLKAVTSGPPATLGVSLVVSVLFAIWGARSAMSTLITALNIAYGEEEKRGVFRFQFAAFALTAAGILFAVVALALVALLPAVIGLLPLGDTGKTVASVLRWPILVIAIMAALAAIYRYAPSRSAAKWRWVSWGAAVATLLWIAGSALFSVYVSAFASYNKTYGSLGGVVVLQLWLYLSAYAILLGAELNAEMEHQTARDTTTDPEEPMGRRGARMADTVAGQE
jgi:membrane protein